MGTSWSWFGPQNDIIKLHWALLEASQDEAKRAQAKALLELLTINSPPDSESSDEPEEECWQARELEFRVVIIKRAK